MAPLFRSRLWVASIQLILSGCLFPNTNVQSEIKDPSVLAAAPARCFDFEPSSALIQEVPTDAWLVTLHAIGQNGEPDKSIIGFGKTNDEGRAHVCLKPEHAGTALIAQASHVGMVEKLSRYLSTHASGGTYAVDSITTYITQTLLSIHQLELSGPISNVTDGDFEALLAEFITLMPLKTLTEFETVWGRVVGNQPSIGTQSACLNTPFASGTFTLGDMQLGGDSSSLHEDGSLAAVAGHFVNNNKWMVNDVNLHTSAVRDVHVLNPPLSGTHIAASAFDSHYQLNAQMSWVQLNNGRDPVAPLPCVAAIMTIENESKNKARLKSGPLLCFEADAQIHSQYAVFSNAQHSGNFVLSLPGIRGGTQDDFLRIENKGKEVCVSLIRDQELAKNSEMGDMASVLLSLCHIPTGKESEIATQMKEASRPGLEAGLLNHPTRFSTDELAQQISRADFINNPQVISFLKTDVRDSLLNFNQGNKTNLFVTGKGINQEYTLYLNGAGDPLATIVTGPQGQFSGGLNLGTAQEGDFIRFVSPGRHFDVPIKAACVNNARAL